MGRGFKVTIGLCVKNVEQTIKEALSSVLEQDFPHELMELIVADGCSEDKTLSVIKEELSKADMKYKIFRENSGLGWARQIIVDNAHGDYIVWVDGDMILPSDYIRRQVEFMEQNPLVGIGRAKYGILPKEKSVAFLENIPFAVESLKYKHEVPLEISGTEGSIYRLEAIKQAGGFDTKIVGAGEDIDLAQRIRAVGWLACITSATFYEKCRETWKALWDEYFWWGYGGHYVFHKDRNIIKLHKMMPPAGFLAGLLRMSTAYKLTGRKLVFSLPFHYVFKRIAWCFGFMKAHVEAYGHDLRK